MDITQDMALCAPGLIRHDYFSLSDEESLQRRRPALRDLPRAAGGYDWYAAHGLAFPSEEALVRHLRAAIPADSWPSSSACPGSSPWSPGNLP
ncbi:MAG: hypothetical protein IKH77_02415 [Clostridia bacterium]|nr:hypothetical protein [Clostridia bacterium]